MKENWEKVTMITIDDKLEALSETERGALCSHTYQKLRAKGLDVDLATIMVTISLVHSHWSRNAEARLSLVESVAGASSLMP